MSRDSKHPFEYLCKSHSLTDQAELLGESLRMFAFKATN